MTATTSITKITDKTQASSYLGFTSKSTTTELSALKNSDNALVEHVYYAPHIGEHPMYSGTTTPVESALITSRLPRHGEKISSAKILPPYLVYSAFGDHVMQNASSQGPNDKGFMFMEGLDMNTLVRKRSRIFQSECYHSYVVNPLNALNAPDASIVTALGDFVNNYKNQTIEYVASVNPTNNDVSSNFYSRRIAETHNITITSAASGTVLVYVERGSCKVSFAVDAPTNLNLVVICGDGSIEVVSPGTVRKLLLIGKSTVNITDGAMPTPNTLVPGDNVTRVVTDAVFKGSASTPISLTGYSTFGISSRHGIQKIYDTEMYENSSTFYNFEDDNSLTIQRYQVVELATNSSVNETDYLNILAKQFKYQYSITCEIDVPTRMIKSTFWGDYNVYTSVARQLSETKIQSLNIISEVFGTHNYHETMAETFRVNDHAYAFAMPGRYMTCNEKADIAFSTTDVDVVPLVEVDYINSQHSPEIGLVFRPNVLAINATTEVDPDGGSDPVFMGMSKYRKLTVIPTELRSESMFLGSSSQSLAKYQPVNGKIVSVDMPDDKVHTGNVFLRDYKLHEHGLCLRNKYPSKTTGFTLTARVKKTKKADAVLHHRLNATEYHRGSAGVDVMYQDEEELIIRIENADGDAEIMSLAINGAVKTSTVHGLSPVEYKYISTGVSPDPYVYELQHKVPPNLAFSNLMTIVHDTAPQTEEDVKLFVAFPSLILTATSNFITNVTTNTEIVLPYVAINTVGEVHCVLSSFHHDGTSLPLTNHYVMEHEVIDVSNLPYELHLSDEMHVPNPYIKTAQNMLVRKDDFAYSVDNIVFEPDSFCMFTFLGKKGYDAYVTHDRIQYLPSGQVYLPQQLIAYRIKSDGFLESVIVNVDSTGKVAYSDFSFIIDNSVRSVHFVDGGQRREETLEQFITQTLLFIRGAFETIIKSHDGLKITLSVEDDGGLKIGMVEKEDPESNLPSTLHIIIDGVPYHFTIYSGDI